jgi:hypothetical protein
MVKEAPADGSDAVGVDPLLGDGEGAASGRGKARIKARMPTFAA